MKTLFFIFASVACAQTPTLVAHAAAPINLSAVGAASFDGFTSPGFSATGSAGQTCTIGSFNGGGSGAAGTLTLTGTNTVANLTPILLTNVGTGYSAAPTTATASSGTATCSGTIGLTQVGLGAAQTSAINSAACTQHCAFVLFVAKSPSAGLTTPYDSVGNVYVQAPPLPTTTPTVLQYPIHEDGDVGYQTWLCIGCSTSASHTFTSVGIGTTIAVMVFQNGASGPDQQNNSGVTGDAESGTATPSNNDEIIVSGVGVCGTGSYAISGGGLSTLDTVNWNGGYFGNVGLADAYAIQTTATAVHANWNTGDGCSATQIVTLFSAAAPATLQATNTPIVEGFENVLYSFTFTATGGVAPYTCGTITGLPTGITQGTGNLTCTISGTPTVTASATSISVTFTDDVGSMASTSGLAITIASTILSISTTSLPTGTQYGTYSSSVVATGGTVGAGYTFSIGPYPSASLPEGITMNASTGALTSSQIGGQGTYGVQFCVTDSLNYQACKFLNIGLAGSNAFLQNIFPSNSIFRTKIDLADCSTCVVDTSPVGPIATVYQSEKITFGFGNASGGAGHTPNGIPVIEVPYNQSDVGVTVTAFQFYYGTPGSGNPNTCTSGTCPTTAPIPANQPIEDSVSCGSGCDSHTITYVESGGGNKPMLYEQDQGIPNAEPATSWQDISNALWPDVTSNAMPPQGYGTTDAAGLPVAPLLINADEVIGTGTPTAPNGAITHVSRFTLNHVIPYYVWPATTNYASCCGNCPGYNLKTQLSQASPPASCSANPYNPYGEIYRLTLTQYQAIQAGTLMPCYHAGTCPQAAIITDGFYHYGIILADAGITGEVIGTPDTRWVDPDLAHITALTLADFEPVNVSSINTGGNTSYQTGASTLPTITTTCPMPAAIVGQPYSQTLLGTNPPITWTIAIGSLPTGLSLSGAVISGTPTTAQVASFSIGASNGSGAGTNSPLACSITVTAFQQPNGIGIAGSVTVTGSIRIAQ